MSDSFKAGQYEISKCDLYNFDKSQKVSLKAVIRNMVISEDIFRSHIIGHVDIIDGETLLQSFPILGEEWLEIEFICLFRGENTKRSYKCFVYAVSDYAINWNTTTAVYRLRFFSEEAYTNITKFRSRHLTGTVSELVKKVFQEDDFLKSTREINVQETVGVINYTSPKITCFEILDYLRQRAISSKDKDSHMFFLFEKHNGFFFKSQGQLVEDALNKLNTNVDDGTSNSIFFRPTSHMSDYADTEEKVRTIIELQFSNIANTFEAMREGFFNQTTYSYDFTNRNYNTKKYNQLESFRDINRFDDMGSQTSGKKHSQKFLESITEETRYNFIIADSTQPDYEDLISKYSHKAAYIQGLIENPIIATMYGDTTIEIGDILNFELPEVSASNTERDFDRHWAGNYMVGRQVHQFTENEHIMTLHLYKDAFRQEPRPGTEFPV